MTTNLPQKTPAEQPKPASDPEGRMTFTAHLGELRTRMIHSMIAIVVGFVICVPFSEAIFQALKSPLTPLKTVVAPEVGGGAPGATPEAASETAATDDRPVDWMVTTPFEGFMVQLKISFYAGLVLALPVIIFQICAFVFPGLTATEKRIVRLVLGGGTVLAIVGISVAYFGILRTAMPGILSYVPEGVKVNLRISETLTIILKALLAFGLAFQMPMIVLVLVYVGILTPAALKAYRKFAIVAIFIFAAVLTPPDAISLFLMAIPLLLLYEFSILTSYVVVRRKAKAAVAAGA